MGIAMMTFGDLSIPLTFVGGPRLVGSKRDSVILVVIPRKLQVVTSDYKCTVTNSTKRKEMRMRPLLSNLFSAREFPICFPLSTSRHSQTSHHPHFNNGTTTKTHSKGPTMGEEGDQQGYS